MNTEKMEKLANEFAKIIRREGLDYNNFNRVCKMCRKVAGLKPPKRKEFAHELPSDAELHQFLDVLAKAPLKQELMIKLLWFTGIRNFELCGIKMEDVYLDDEHGRIYIHGKGGSNGYVAIPQVLIRDINKYLKDVEGNIWLFESRVGSPYTTAGFRAIVRKYRKVAGVSDNVYPHKFRHLYLTKGADLGGTEYDIMTLGRHRRSSSSSIYVNRNIEKVRGLANKIAQNFNTL